MCTRKWEGEIINERNAKKVISEYNSVEYFLESLAYAPFVKDMEYEQIRDAATFIDTFSKYYTFDKDIYYAKYSLVKNNLNDWFDAHLSANMLALYNFFDSSYNTEKWGGERRYALLTRNNNKGYSEMSCLKAAVRFQHLQDENPKLLTSIGSAKLLSKYLRTPYWGFGAERNLYDYDSDTEEGFRICNRMRKKEILLQDKFIDAIFIDKDINKAYDIMPESDRIIEE